MKSTLTLRDVFTICVNAPHLVGLRTQSKQLGVPGPLPRLPIEAVQLLVAAEGRQPLHSLIWG